MLRSNFTYLLASLEYDQNAMKGPPYSVPDTEVRELFSWANIELLEQNERKNIMRKGVMLESVMTRIYIITNK